MARGAGDIVLDDGQQKLLADMCRVIDACDDDLVLMNRTQDLINMLLKRNEDALFRDQTLGEISRFFLGLMKVQDLSEEYRSRKLKMFSKASLKILIAKRPKAAAQATTAGDCTSALRRAGDGEAATASP